MNTVFLDCRQMSDRKEAHAYLAQMLDFPAWYGGNLDALFDLLSESGPLALVVEQVQALSALGDYGQALLSTLREAADKNPRLSLSFAENPVNE